MAFLQLNHQEILEFLFNQGLVYRYPLEYWKNMQQNCPGHPYPTMHRFLDNGIVEEAIQPLAEPLFISQSASKGLEQISQTITLFFNATWEFVINGESSMNRKQKQILINSCLTPSEIENLKIYSGYPMHLPYVRLDCLKTPGGFKIVDINSTRPAGVGEQIILNTGFADSIQDDQASFPMDKIFLDVTDECLTSWINMHSGQTRKIVFAIPDLYGDYHNSRVLSEIIDHDPRFNGCTLVNLQSDNINISDCGLIIRARIKEDHPKFVNLKSYYPEKCCVITPLYKRWLGNKLWIYYFLGPLASYYQSKMGIDNYLILRDALPKTGKIDSDKEVVDFPDEKINSWHLERKGYLFKPGKGSSAKGIIFGCDSNRNKWLNALSRAAPDSIIQEYLPVKEKVKVLNEYGIPIEKELYTKYGIFILGGKLAGLEVMARPSRIVHGARDTYISPVFSTLDSDK